MKILGIDYGEKRIGIAITDPDQKMAFPKSVFLNDNNLLFNIKKLVKEEGILKIVMGESLDFNMKENPIMEEIRKFSEVLKKETECQVVLFPEVLTSHQAAKMMGEKNEMIDASAAAIMLQSYLDSKAN